MTVKARGLVFHLDKYSEGECGSYNTKREKLGNNDCANNICVSNGNGSSMNYVLTIRLRMKGPWRGLHCIRRISGKRTRLEL